MWIKNFEKIGSLKFGLVNPIPLCHLVKSKIGEFNQITNKNQVFKLKI